MFNPIINLNNYFKIKTREEFTLGLGPLVSGGNTTNIGNKTVVKKNFENNQNIDRSMVVNSITKLVNDVSNDVIQRNTATASSAVGSSNTIWLSNIKCDTVNISGIRQGAKATLEQQVSASQSNTNKIVNEISSNIDKKIEKVGATDLAKLQAENTKQLNDYMNVIPGFEPDKAQKLASKCPNTKAGLFSVGNTCNVNNSYELDSSVKQFLNIDESFKINDTDDVNNVIKNKIEQSNFASCQATASASNQIMIQDIQCTASNVIDRVNNATGQAKPSVNISDIEQQAISQLYMTCVFNQSNVNDIANKIVNRISKKYNQIYDEVERIAKEKGNNGGPEYYKKATDFLDTLSAAGMEQIHASAGNLEERPPEEPSSKAIDTNQSNTRDSTASTDIPTGNIDTRRPTNNTGVPPSDFSFTTPESGKVPPGPTSNNIPAPGQAEQTRQAGQAGQAGQAVQAGQIDNTLLYIGLFVVAIVVIGFTYYITRMEDED